MRSRSGDESPSSKLAAADFFTVLKTLPGLEVLGLQAYAGHVQHIVGYEQRRTANQTCLDIAAKAMTILREQGLNNPILSVGGTGSCRFDAAHPDVTEIQAGSYTLDTPKGKTIELSFSRIDDDTIAVTLGSGGRERTFHVTSTGQIQDA